MPRLSTMYGSRKTSNPYRLKSQAYQTTKLMRCAVLQLMIKMLWVSTSAPSTLRTFDTLELNAPTDLIAQTEFRLLLTSSVFIERQVTIPPALFDANPYTLSTIQPNGDSSIVEPHNRPTKSINLIVSPCNSPVHLPVFGSGIE